jgi:hypothetical protein
MTIEQADVLRNLLNERDALLSSLDDIRACTVIRGEISDGVNGRPFTWKPGSVYHTVLVKGLSEEIAAFDDYIAKSYICTRPEEVTDNEA